MRQPEGLRLTDQPQHAVGAVTRARLRFIKGVHGGYAVFQHVQDGHHAQGTSAFVRAGFTKLHQARIDPALQQKLGVLLDAVVVHAAAGVATVLVAQIQIVVLRHETQPGHARLQVSMPTPRPALAAIRRESIGQYAQRYAGLAAVAMRPVGEQTAAPKALADQFGIRGIVDEVAWGGHLRTRLPSIEVAARIRCRGVELQRL